MIRKRINRTETTPRTVTTVLIGTDGSYGESARRRPAITSAATIVITRTIGMNSSASQALPPLPGTLPENPLIPETSTPNQSKNMKMKSRIAEPPAIFSPGLSLSRWSINPPVGLGVGATLHPSSRGGQRIYEQHCNCHRAHSAGHGGDRGCDLSGRLEVDIADQAGVGPVDPDVDHHPAGLDRVAAEQAWHTDSGDEHVGATTNAGQVAGARVAHRHRRVGRQEEAGDGNADKLRTPDNHHIGPFEINTLVAKQHHHAGRGAGNQTRHTLSEATGVDRGQPVDVLARIDRGGDPVG